MGKVAREERLVGVHPKLIAVTKLAISRLPFDVLVVEGVRSREQCMINWGKGRSIAQCAAWKIPATLAKPNLKKVTWLANPFNSKHLPQHDGFGHAVDLLGAPFTEWAPLSKFDKVAAKMLEAAKELGVKVTWGADWDRDNIAHEKGETDSPHFQIEL